MKNTQLEFSFDGNRKASETPAPLGPATVPFEELRMPHVPTEPEEPAPFAFAATASPVSEPTGIAESANSMDQPGRSNYGAGHPWHYLREGDHAQPCPVGEIPPAEDVGQFIANRLPKNPAKRTVRLRELLADEQHQLDKARCRYQEIVDHGIAALSRYDREIAYGGNDELARAASLALTYHHVAWSLGRVAWLQRQLPGDGPIARQSTLPKPGHATDDKPSK